MTERALITVRAAFRHFPGCCPETVEPGEPMVRLAPTGRYVHVGCADREVSGR